MAKKLEIVSVRNLQALFSTFAILVCAVVCTLLATVFYDQARSATDETYNKAVLGTQTAEQRASEEFSRQSEDTISACFATAQTETLAAVNAQLVSVKNVVKANIEMFLERPQTEMKVTHHFFRTLHPRELYTSYEHLVELLRRQMGSKIEQYEGIFSHIMWYTTITPYGEAQYAVWLEDDDTLGKENSAGVSYGDFHHMTVSFSSGRPMKNWTGVGDLEEQINPTELCAGCQHQRCLGVGKPCAYIADIVPDLNGADVTSGSWATEASGSCPLGDCPGVYGFGNDCWCNRKVTDTQGDCEKLDDPILRDPEHSASKWASGRCGMTLTPSGELPYKLAMIVLPLNTMKWTPVVSFGPYFGMVFVANFGHPAQMEEPYRSLSEDSPVDPFPTNCPASILASLGMEPCTGKGGGFFIGVDIRQLTGYLTAARERLQDADPCSEARIFLTVGDDWIADKGLSGRSTGNIVGVSHGKSYGLEESCVFTECRLNPKPLNAKEASDITIRSTAAWIEAQGPTIMEAYLNVDQRVKDNGGNIRVSVELERSAPAAPDCQFLSDLPTGVNNETFYLSTTRFTNEYGIDWWTIVLIDHQSVLGKVQRASEETQRVNQERVAETAEMVRRQREKTVEQIAADKKVTDDNLAEDQMVLIGVVVAITLVLVVLSVLVISAVTAPILALAKQMADVAMMQLDAVDTDADTSRLSEVKKMQRSFRRMVMNMRELRNFLPQSVLMDTEETEDEQLAGGAKSIRASLRESKASISAAGSHHGKTSKHATSKAGSSMQGSHAASSRSAAMRAYIKKVAGDGLKKKKVTVLVTNAKGWHARLDQEKDTDIVHIHTGILNAQLAAVTLSKGCMESFSGDRTMSSFNAIKPVGTHRTLACTCREEITKQLQAEIQMSDHGSRSKLDSLLPISAAACTGNSHCGNVGCTGMKHHSIFSSNVTFAFAVERFGRSIDVAGLVVDPGVFEEATNNFQTVSLGQVKFAKRSRKEVAVYCLYKKKDASEDEWMYQLEEGQKETGEVGVWNRAVKCALAENWDDARSALAEADLQQMMQTPVGEWLRAAVEEQRKPVTEIKWH